MIDNLLHLLFTLFFSIHAGLIREVVRHHSQVIYTRATKGADEEEK